MWSNCSFSGRSKSARSAFFSSFVVPILYEKNVFIPYELTARSAGKPPGLKVRTHPEWFHDGIWVHGTEVARGLFEMLDEIGASAPGATPKVEPQVNSGKTVDGAMLCAPCPGAGVLGENPCSAAGISGLAQ